jgi:hypothetical protein
MIENLTSVEAQELARDYVCSDCWGTLAEYYDRETRAPAVHCSTEGCPCNGLVSKSFVERRKAESRAELSEARIALRDAVPWLRGEKKSVEQLLKELGF